MARRRRGPIARLLRALAWLLAGTLALVVTFALGLILLFAKVNPPYGMAMVSRRTGRPPRACGRTGSAWMTCRAT